MNKNKIKCNVTGKILHVRPDVFDRRVQIYGSEDILRRKYISAEARRLLKTGMSIDDVRKKFNVTDKTLPSAAELLDLHPVNNNVSTKKSKKSNRNNKSTTIHPVATPVTVMA